MAAGYNEVPRVLTISALSDEVNTISDKIETEGYTYFEQHYSISVQCQKPVINNLFNLLSSANKR